jgi:hypothetical protein
MNIEDKENLGSSTAREKTNESDMETTRKGEYNCIDNFIEWFDDEK